jgi:hypothetical protein
MTGFVNCAFICECGHLDDPSDHPNEGPCTRCECPGFKWAAQDEHKPAVSKEYPKREG